MDLYEDKRNCAARDTSVASNVSAFVWSIFRLVLVVKAVDNGSLLNRKEKKDIRRKVTCHTS